MIATDLPTLYAEKEKYRLLMLKSRNNGEYVEYRQNFLEANELIKRILREVERPLN